MSAENFYQTTYSIYIDSSFAVYGIGTVAAAVLFV